MHLKYGSLWHPNPLTHQLFFFYSNDNDGDDEYFDYWHSGVRCMILAIIVIILVMRMAVRIVLSADANESEIY